MITWAYLGGLFDGEGSIGVALNYQKGGSTHRRPMFHPFVQLTNSNQTLRQVMQGIGFGASIIPRKGNTSAHDQYYMHNWSDILHFLLKIREYLVFKQEQARVMLELCKTRIMRMPKQFSTQEEALANRLRTMNSHKGPQRPSRIKRFAGI
jgi:hypothetical protein